MLRVRPCVFYYKMAEKQDGTPCAWVTLIMLGDSYVPGALVLAESLRLVQTKHQLVCMVTPGVSEDARAALRCVYDRVVCTRTVHRACSFLPGRRQALRYGMAFLSRVCTKWFCLTLEDYRLVCFVDADIAFQKNPDDLFNLQAPAGSFVNPWQKEDRFYMWPKHGQRIDNKYIQRAMAHRTGFVVFGSLVLLEPDKSMFVDLTMNIGMEGTHGNEILTTSGPDELAICQLMLAKKKEWTHIGPRYQAISWKTYGPSGVINARDIIGYHYHGEQKPWDMKIDQWPDLHAWFTAALHLSARATQDKDIAAVLQFLTGDMCSRSHDEV